MFGGGSSTFHRPLRVGETATHTREIVAIDEKEGTAGPLVLVRVRHEIEGDTGPAVTEVQTIVYTDAPPGPRTDGGSVVPETPWQQRVTTDPVLLFRFSALTFNAHRIHYDHPYATRVEGYRDLVVHGPLTALLLAELARNNGVAMRAFRFRARAPVFAGEALELRGTPTSQGADLRAYCEGSLVMDATAERPVAGG
jgi:3-methylfumaryl-CoA hydratase